MLLDKMKELAAKHGANTIVLNTSEPQDKTQSFLGWGAVVYRARQWIQEQDDELH